MVWLLPIEGTSLFVTILSAVTLLVMLVWVAPGLWQGWKAQMNAIDHHLYFQVFVTLFVGVIALFLVIIYGMGKDLSLAARYHFVYFPIVIILLAATLAKCWDNWENQTEVENVFSDKQKSFPVLRLRDSLQKSVTGKIKEERATKKDLFFTFATGGIISEHLKQKIKEL